MPGACACPCDTGLDLKWAAASEFIRDIYHALGRPQPPPEAIVNLSALALEVIGQIEELKATQTG